MKTLTLASPFVTGKAVKEAQRALRDAGHYGGALDGIYGPVTANATRAAKWALGFSRGQVNEAYGAVLHALLTGKREPSPAMRLRARQRRRPPRTVGSRAAERMVAWFVEGWKEQPSGSNRVPPLQALCRSLGLSPYYSGMGYPWCALAVFTAALAEGSESAAAGLKRGLFNALYTPEIRAVAARGAHGLRQVSRSEIEHGTGLLMNFGGSNGGEVDHIGLALGKPGERVTVHGTTYKPRASEVVTVEGNTSYDSSGSQANGGAVAVRVRPLTEIAAAFTLS